MSEQTTETTSAGATSAPAAERDTLIAAVEAATKGDDTPATTPAEGAQEPEAAAPPAERLSKVGAVLRERERRQAEREAKEQRLQELETLKRDLEEREAAIKKRDDESAALLAKVNKLKAAPMEAIKELGWDTKQLVNEVAREGSPEWQAQKRLEAIIEAQQKKLSELEEWKGRQDKAREESEAQARVYARQQTEQRFLSLIGTESPVRQAFKDAVRVVGQEAVDRLILERAHSVADRYREKTGGAVASLEEVRDYLEELASRELASRQESGGLGSSVAPQKVAHQSKASGPRALSVTAASERRTSPKPRTQWTPEEEYQALKAAAEAAMK